jgi:hypothetical protein
MKTKFHTTKNATKHQQRKKTVQKRNSMALFSMSEKQHIPADWQKSQR